MTWPPQTSTADAGVGTDSEAVAVFTPQGHDLASQGHDLNIDLDPASLTCGSYTVAEEEESDESYQWEEPYDPSVSCALFVDILSF